MRDSVLDVARRSRASPETKSGSLARTCWSLWLNAFGAGERKSHTRTVFFEKRGVSDSQARPTLRCSGPRLNRASIGRASRRSVRLVLAWFERSIRPIFDDESLKSHRTGAAALRNKDSGVRQLMSNRPAANPSASAGCNASKLALFFHSHTPYPVKSRITSSLPFLSRSTVARPGRSPSEAGRTSRCSARHTHHSLGS